MRPALVLLLATIWLPSAESLAPNVAKSIAKVQIPTGRCSAFSPMPRVWVTKLHCAEDGYEFKILGEKAEFVKEDIDLDLLLLTGPVVPSIRVAKTEPNLGDQITLFGWPLAWDDAASYISYGHMSALGVWRDADKYGNHFDHQQHLNAVDGTCYFGMSGGPAVNRRGEVVGVIDSFSQNPPIPIAYITPLKDLRKFLGLT